MCVRSFRSPSYYAFPVGVGLDPRYNRRADIRCGIVRHLANFLAVIACSNRASCDRSYHGCIMGVLVHMSRLTLKICRSSILASLALVFLASFASADENADTKVLASWICTGDNIGLHRQKNGADGVFSDYVPLESGAEIHLTASKNGHNAFSIHTENEPPVVISSQDEGTSVLWNQSDDQFNEHFWAYKPNYSFELYKEKISPTKFFAYEISTTFYDTLEGKTKLRQFTRLYECERIAPMDVRRLKAIHRNPKQNYTCLLDPFQITRDNRVSVDGNKGTVTFWSVDSDTLSSIAAPKNYGFTQILRKAQYNLFSLDNDDLFAINPTSLVGIRVVDQAVLNSKYQCSMD